MGSKNGYEYRYRLWMDDSMIPRYSWYELHPDIKFVFETRTNFVVKRSDGEEILIDSERLEKGGDDDDTDESWLHNMMRRRLQEYWMSPDEVRELVGKAFAFAKEKEADPQNATLRFIPVAIELDVCTVQKVGEPVADVFDRAIRAQHLFPASLIEDNNLVEVEGFVDGDYLAFLRCDLETYRVESVEIDWNDMEAGCPLCSRMPTIGAQIAVLDGCRHRFHYHCILGWLLNNKSCPICKSCPTCGHLNACGRKICFH